MKLHLTLDLSSSRPVNFKRATFVFVKTIGHEKTLFIVVLQFLLNGDKILPMVTLKLKMIPKSAIFPKCVVVRTHPNGCIDEKITNEWLNKIQYAKKVFEHLR